MSLKQDFRRDGYSFPHTVLSPHEAAVARKNLEAFLDKWIDDPTLNLSLNDYCRANFHLISKWGAQVAKNPAILDAVENIIGPDILCWMTEVIIKEPGSNKIISMHQDLTYWGMGQQGDAVMAWLALTDATPDNGCMQFVTSSHLHGQVQHNDTYAKNNLLSRGQEISVDYDEKDTVFCALRAGEVSFYHGHMFHGSGPNITDDRRIGIVMRYVSAKMKSTKLDRDYALLVRGANRQDNFICVAEPGADFTPASMALYDEVTKVQMSSLAGGATDNFGYETQKSR